MDESVVLKRRGHISRRVALAVEAAQGEPKVKDPHETESGLAMSLALSLAV
jgi:hypothetical protein